MKRVGNLWSELTSFANMLAAAQAAAAGKRRRPDVAAFLLNLESELLALRRELVNGTYQPGGYRTFAVRDPKPRRISAAPFRDRVVHHALTRILEPIFEERFSPYSFACRPAMGTHKAIRRAYEGVCRYQYVLKCDVSKYFASIDHDILNMQLARVVKCRPTLELAARIIAGSNAQEEVIRYFPGDNLFTPFERRRGLPLGNQTSQFFANVYLNGLDRTIGSELRPPVWARYVDDFVLFGSDKERLRAMKSGVEEKLAGLRLMLHPAKSRVHRCAEGLTFLGWRLFPGRIRLARENVIRFGKRMKRMQLDLAAGRIGWSRVDQGVKAWIAHASFSDWEPVKTWALRQEILARFTFRAGI
jgi:retron-type reverse transcriptase